MSTAAAAIGSPEPAQSSRANSGGDEAATATSGEKLFSPRSAAAMALTGFSRQDPTAIGPEPVPSSSSEPCSASPRNILSTTDNTAPKAPLSSAAKVVPPPTTGRRHSMPDPRIPSPSPAHFHYPPPPPPHHHHHHYPGKPYTGMPIPPPWVTTPHSMPHRRTSDPGMMGPMPPYPPAGPGAPWDPHHTMMPMAYYPPPSVMSSNIKARRPSEMQSFVTPTPKKARITGDKSYNRKKKSLGLLAQSFLERFSNSPSGEEVYIDRLAQELAVERRRIYDVVNILESLRIVIKRGKNSYTWMGTTHLPRMFALVQHDAIFEYPQDALDNGIIDQKPSDQEIHAAQTNRNMSESKSLSRLSQLFLRIFLVGHQTLSLPEASDKINKEVTSMDDLAAIGCKDRCPIPDDPVLYKQAAMRGLKTKIRRMYDISNCFASIGLIKKVDERCMPMESRRPRFRWCYKMSAQDISKVYKDLPEQMKRKRTPFLEGVETMTTTMPTPSSWLPGLAPSPNAVSLAAASAHQTPMPPPLSQTSTSSCDTTSTKSVSESSNEENALLSMINQTGGAVSATKEDHRRQPAANKDSLAQLAARGLPVY